MLNSTHDDQLITRTLDASLYRTKGGQVKKVIDYSSTYFGISSPFEVELLHTIQHPYLLSANGINIDEKKITIFLPAADYDLLDGSRFGFSEEELITFFYQVSLALLALHQQKIAHCDIKPENILIFNGRIAKLADFGLCRYLHKPIKCPPLGTPLYVSTEMFEAMLNDHDVILELSSDLWSLGMTFYFLFSQDYYYDLTDGRYLDFQELYNKNETLWLSGKSYDNLSKVKHPIIREILANLLTFPEKRWPIEQVVTYLEKIVTPQEHIDLIFPEKPLPQAIQVRISQYCRYLDVDPDACYPWIRRLLAHLKTDTFSSEETAVVLLYLALMYKGNTKPIFCYLAAIVTSITVERFIALEEQFFDQLYPRPTIDTLQQGEQQDNTGTGTSLQPQSGTAIFVTKSEKRGFVKNTTPEELE